jgi:GST-like protein
MFGQYNHFRLYAPKGNVYAAARYFTETMRLFQVMEDRLADNAFLGGAEYSIADMAAFPWAALHDRLGLPWDRFTHLPRWRDAIAERPATKRAYAAEAPFMPGALAAMRDATESEKDRFFGRVADLAFQSPM